MIWVRHCRKNPSHKTSTIPNGLCTINPLRISSYCLRMSMQPKVVSAPGARIWSVAFIALHIVHTRRPQLVAIRKSCRCHIVFLLLLFFVCVYFSSFVIVIALRYFMNRIECDSFFYVAQPYTRTHSLLSLHRHHFLARAIDRANPSLNSIQIYCGIPFSFVPPTRTTSLFNMVCRTRLFVMNCA